MKSTVFWPLLVLVFCGRAFAGETAAQPGQVAVTLQYLPNSAYETVIGLGVYSFRSSSPGFYFSGQVSTTTTSERDDYYQNLSPASFGHPVADYLSDFASVNAGMTYAVGDHLGLYLGLGYASITGYAELVDPQRILDPDGYYLVRDTVPDDNGVNVNSGLLLLLGSVSIELGYHSFIKQGFVGIGLSF
jgi:hypothetical protein